MCSEMKFISITWNLNGSQKGENMLTLNFYTEIHKKCAMEDLTTFTVSKTA